MDLKKHRFVLFEKTKSDSIQENVFHSYKTFHMNLNLTNTLDYDLQFEKSFVEPLKTILNIDAIDPGMLKKQ